MSRMKSSERRMKIILMLQENRKDLTADKLAELFGVSRRTIFRDLNALSEINVPVTWERYSGYGVVPGFRMPPLMFSSKELATIMVGLNFVKSQVDQNLVEDARGVEIKIRHSLPEELRHFMESLSGRTIVDPFLRFGPAKRKGGSWYLVSSAISQNLSIEFHYQARGRETRSRRLIDPYLLVFYRDHWNVIGYSEKRKDMRNFILDRMSDIRITDRKFELKEEIDAEALIFRSDSSGHEIDIEVASTCLERFETNLPTKIIKKEKENSENIKVTFRFDNLDYINEWLLQFADQVRVKGPKELVEKRAELLRKMAESL